MPSSRSSVVVALALTVAAAVRAAPGPPASPSDDVAAKGQALRNEATALFKQKKYALACEKFRAAGSALPDDAALLTDLALCQQRLGQNKEATESNLRAIAVASRDGKQIADQALGRARRHAYFNLHKLDADLAGGYSNDGSCVELDAAAGCATKFHACAYGATQGWAVRMYSRTMLKLALTAADAVWTEDEKSQEAFTEPSSLSARETPEIEETSVLVITSFEEEGRTHTCDWNDGWTCEKSDAVAAAARACLATAGTPAKPGDQITHTPCFKQACGAFQKKPTKAVRREKQLAEKRVSRCEDEITSNVGGAYSCDVVYANACTGLVATACDAEESKRNRKPTTDISEYHVVRGQAEAPTKPPSGP